MQNSVKKMLRQMFRDKKRQKRIVAVICALSVLVATGVFNELMQPVITMTPDPVCGVAEHAHTSECYQNQLVCGIEESEEHAHGDGCFESVLACGKSEHKHGDSCYPEEIKDQPVVTAEPEVTAEPTEVPAVPATVSEEAPEVTAEPESTKAPEVTAEPEITAEPEVTAEPEITAEPEVTAEPETTEVPEVTAEPETTEVPEVTAEPETTEVPEVTAEPETTAEPDPTAEPAEPAEPAAPAAPAITGATASAETAFVGQTVTWTFAAEGASELTYSIDDSEGNSVASGALDAGATCVSWLADRAGAFTLTVTAVNEFGAASITGAVTVEAAAELTAAVRGDSASAFAGESATFHFAVSGGVEPTAISITVEQDGETLAALDAMTDSVTVESRHMGDKVTTLTATITAADSLGTTVSDSVQIPVAVRIHETESDWIKATETELTDDWRENLIAVAKTQLGYEESRLDFVIDEEGNAQGYTRYGQWWGASHDEWCAMFASFCLNYAEIPDNDFPREANCEKWIDALNSRGLYAAADEVQPEAGDLIFFDWENDGKCDHVGIVTDADTETIATIEGNSAASVRTREYEAGDECIIGFGLLTKAFERHLADELDLDLETGVGAQALVLEDAILRAEPAADSLELAALTAETLVTVTAAEQNLDKVWYEITTGDLTGYLPAATLALNYVAEEDLVEVEPEVETPSVEITSARETNAEGVELVTFTAALNGISEADYIWQWQSAETAEGPWTDIEGATGLTYTAELTDAVLASYYRIHGAYIALPEEESALMTLSMDEVSETETVDAEITPAESTDNDVYSAAYAVEMPVVLTGEGADYTVTVTYGSDANIPAEATLSVREIEPGTEEYDEYYASMMEVLYPEQVAAVAAYAEEQAAAAMAIAEDEPATVTDECCEPAIPEVPTPTFLRLFDICIMMDGVEIEPAAEVDVNIEFHSGITSPETDELSIIHFHEDEAPEMVEGHREGGSVDFKADRFSTYGVATVALGDQDQNQGGSSSGSYETSASKYFNNSENVNYFYWRFVNDIDGSSDETGQLSSTIDGKPLKEVVTVTYTPDATKKTGEVDYYYYNQTVADGSTSGNSTSVPTLKCATVLGNPSSSSSTDDWTLNITTEVGYVITSYRIACEPWRVENSNTNPQNGEDCNTIASNSGLIVSLDTTGLYQSNITVEYDAAAFGHSSNSTPGRTGGLVDNNYVLLLTIAEVNVDLKVDKAANKESVGAGDVVTYTVDATTTNDLTKVQFTDAFFKSIVEGTLKVSISSDGTNYTALKESSSNFSSYSGMPSQYYLDEDEGIIYLNGKWTSAYTVRITYGYQTQSAQANSTITNTVIATGTKTDTTDTVQDLGVAQVKVIVNELTLGSIRVYKTFKGLLTNEVLGTSTTTGVLAGYKITVTDSSDQVVKTLSTSDGTLAFYASDTDSEPITYTYYGDITGLAVGTYTVTETGYTVEGYRCSSTYGVYLDSNSDDDYEDDGETTTGSGATATGSVIANKTTFVRFTNSYGNSQHLVQVKKVWKSEAPSSDLPITLTGTYGDSTITRTATLSADNNWTYVFGIDDSDWPDDASEYTWTATETLPTGYYQVGDPSVVEDSTYTVTTTVNEYDDNGNITGTHTETKEYSCDVVTLTNAKYASLTISKVDESGDSLSGATFQLHKYVMSTTDGVSSLTKDNTFAVQTYNIGTQALKLEEGYYSLTETAAPAGYYMLTSVIYFRVDANGNVILTYSTGENLSSTEGLAWKLENGTLTITNHTGTELPSTGGPGKYIYTICGLFFMAASLLCGIGQRRKRERGEEI